jgi:hypothetical protein
LPFVFDRSTLAGTVDVENAMGDELVISPESRQVRSAYPRCGSVQNFDRSRTGSDAATK